MTEEQQHDIAVGSPRDRIDIFLDGAAEPLLSTTPPLSFELDTSLMEDGPAQSGDMGNKTVRRHR